MDGNTALVILAVIGVLGYIAMVWIQRRSK
jgi:hypothetical protein